MTDALLRIEGLTAGYDRAAVIRDVGLTVGQGEVVALLGANGAGKTTTLRVISGLVRPLSGSIAFVPNADYVFEIKSSDGRPQNYWFEFEHTP